MAVAAAAAETVIHPAVAAPAPAGLREQKNALCCRLCSSEKEPFFWAKQGHDAGLICEECAKRVEPNKAKRDVAEAKELSTASTGRDQIPFTKVKDLVQLVRSKVQNTKLVDGDNHLCYCVAVKVRDVLEQWACDIERRYQAQEKVSTEEASRVSRLLFCFGALTRSRPTVNISENVLHVEIAKPESVPLRLTYRWDGRPVFEQGELQVPKQFLPQLELTSQVFKFDDARLEAKVVFAPSVRSDGAMAQSSYASDIRATPRTRACCTLKDCNGAQHTLPLTVVAEMAAPAPAAPAPAPEQK